MLAEALGNTNDPQQTERQIRDLIALIPSSNPIISRQDLLAAVNSKSLRPGFRLLDDKEKSQYAKNLTREVNKMFDKSKSKRRIQK